MQSATPPNTRLQPTGFALPRSARLRLKRKPYHLSHVDQTITAYANDLHWVGGSYIFIGVDNDGNPISLHVTVDGVVSGTWS